MRFLVDNQLPVLLAAYLRARGHDCTHVLELNCATTSDVDIWALAAAEGRVVVTKDEDFVYLANRAGDTGRLLWVRLGNCRNRALLEAFDRTHDPMIAAFAAGQRVIELR